MRPPNAVIRSQIPKGLIEAIRAGRCIAFVGSGFSGAAGFPTWTSLLEELASRPEADSIRPQLQERIKDKTAHAFDEVAQALEDVLGRETLVEHLQAKMAYIEPQPEMEHRRNLLKNIPFRAVLTTNYDRMLKGDIPGPAVFRNLLHTVRTPWIDTLFVTSRDKKARPLLKLHGDLDKPESIVLTRRDYRKLLYENAHYLNFLRAYLLGYTVLYLGFSFTDAYLNELRSEILTRIDQREGREPIAYAVVNDVSDLSRQHYRRHEGIEILTYDTDGGKVFSGFNEIMQAIHDATNPVMRYQALLEGRHILWVDPRGTDNFRWAHEFFPMRGGREVLDIVLDSDTALDHLDEAARAGRAFDLIVCFWGDEGAPGSASPAPALLSALRRRESSVPILVFAERHIFQQKKRRALELGALGCYYRWENLLRAIRLALDPESETSEI